jgi:hypothetical protein
MSVTPTVKTNRWAERKDLDWRDWISDRHYTEYYCTLFPNLSIHLLIQGINVIFRFRPVAGEPEQMIMDVWIYQHQKFPKQTPLLQAIENGEIPEIVQQDLVNFEHVQKGLRSRSFKGPKLNYFESRIAHFHKLLNSYLD